MYVTYVQSAGVSDVTVFTKFGTPLAADVHCQWYASDVCQCMYVGVGVGVGCVAIFLKIMECIYSDLSEH